MDSSMHERNTSIAVPRDKLVEDLRLVMSDAEDLLQATASQAGDSAAAARARIQKSLRIVKDRLVDAETAVVDRTKEAATATDHYVHEHPWQAIGVSAGVSACVGAIIGMLIARR